MPDTASCGPGLRRSNISAFRPLMIQGGSDFCDEPAASEGLDRYFDVYYRVVLDQVGHFPHREAPAKVAALIGDHLATHHT